MLHCFDDAPEVLSEIARLHAEPSIDAVFLVPHWGIENSTVVERRQRELAQAAFEAGAGGGWHPPAHPAAAGTKICERRAPRLGDLIHGNLISAQPAPVHRVGIIAILELAKASGMAKLD